MVPPREERLRLPESSLVSRVSGSGVGFEIAEGGLEFGAGVGEVLEELGLVGELDEEGAVLVGGEHAVEEGGAGGAFFVEDAGDGAAGVDEEAEGEGKVGVDVEVADRLGMAVDLRVKSSRVRFWTRACFLSRTTTGMLTRRASTERVVVDCWAGLSGEALGVCAEEGGAERVTQAARASRRRRRWSFVMRV